MADKLKRKLLLFYFASTVVVVAVIAKNDQFHEELLLKPMTSGHVYAYFQFTTIWEVDTSADSACE